MTEHHPSRRQLLLAAALMPVGARATVSPTTLAYRFTDRLCVDIMPVALDKQPATTNPRRWAVGAVGTLGAAATLRAALGRRIPRGSGARASLATTAPPDNGARAGS